MIKNKNTKGCFVTGEIEQKTELIEAVLYFKNRDTIIKTKVTKDGYFEQVSLSDIYFIEVKSNQVELLH